MDVSDVSSVQPSAPSAAALRADGFTRAQRRAVASGRASAVARRAVAVPAIGPVGGAAPGRRARGASAAAIGGADEPAIGAASEAAASDPGEGGEDGEASGDRATSVSVATPDAIPVAPDEAAELTTQIAALADAPDAEIAETRRPGRRSFNKHDADLMGGQCDDMLKRIEDLCQQARTPMVNVGLLRSGAEAFVACQLFVELGLLHEDEMRGRVYAQLRGLLAAIMHQLEEAALRAPARGGLAVPARPGIQIARR